MHPRGSILVVDDDESLTGVLAELLGFKGFDVWTADNGIHGYTSYLRHATDIVLTDIQMPELNGIEMMRCIRAINSAVRTIYMTASPDRFSAMLKREKREFASMLLIKPFSSGDLLPLISFPEIRKQSTRSVNCVCGQESNRAESIRSHKLKEGL
jgi:two-component system, OmpR family, response regulator MprA